MRTMETRQRRELTVFKVCSRFALRTDDVVCDSSTE